MFSPDGKKIAYCSNKDNDYFSTSSIYIYNFADSSEKELADHVASELSWSPDGKYLVYSKMDRNNPHWDDLYDLYSYNLSNGDEERFTDGLRAQYPSLSSDGKKVSFVSGSDGTLNLYSADIDLAHNKISNIKELTNYKNGEQVYSTRWSEDGTKIVFDYSVDSSRQIAIYNFADRSVKFVTPNGEDSRDAIFTGNDSSIVYSSDRSGIFNIYKQNLYSGTTAALTNVLGGAFMPALSQSGNSRERDIRLVYSSYQWNGYKIASINDARPIPDPPKYKVDIDPPSFASTAADAPSDTIANVSLENNYNNTAVPHFKSEPYNVTTTSMSFYPVILFDNYNPHANFLDELKAGVYFSSTDVVGKYDIFGGITLNKLLERDIFFQFDYNDKIPILSWIGIYPEFTLSVYNLSRNTNGGFTLGNDSINVGLSYNLTEVDADFSGPFVLPELNLSMGFTFDSYGVTQSGFTTSDGIPFSSLGYTYFIGKTFYAQLDFDGIAPSRNSWINPLGLRTRARLSIGLDRLQDGNNPFEQGTNLIIPNYDSYNFVQGELVNYFALPVFRSDDAFAVKLHLGYTFGKEIPSFFDFYAGGLVGMRGYPFYSLGGNKMVMVDFAYRYPIFRDVDKQLLQFYLSDVYLSAYGDVGDVWDVPADGIIGAKFKKDVGSELRMSGFSFYSFPTAIFFDACYGLDKFTVKVPLSQIESTDVTYGKEWRFYFGVTFSFDIIDFLQMNNSVAGRQL